MYMYIQAVYFTLDWLLDHRLF